MLHNMSLSTKEVQIINSALSVYYSTRNDYNPLRHDIRVLKEKMHEINPKPIEWE